MILDVGGVKLYLNYGCNYCQRGTALVVRYITMRCGCLVLFDIFNTLCGSNPLVPVEPKRLK